MADTSSRTLRLLSLLQSHRHWPGPALADRLGVSVRTLRRDIERLRELGYPVEAQRGADGGYQLAPGAALPPLVLDDEEAVVLVAGLLTVAQHPAAGTAEASVRALGKVIQVMPKRLRRRAEALRSMTEPAVWAPPGAGAAPEVLAAVALACRDAERLDFGYAGADGSRTRRRVEPHRLVSLGSRWYLVGYDLGRHDWRTFRLDRLTAPRTTGVRFAPRRLPGGDAAAFVRERISALPRNFTVDSVVDAPAAAIRSQIGRWATVHELTHGSCRVRISTYSLDWAALALASTGAGFRVQGPPEFAAHLRDWADRFVRATADLDRQA